MTRLDERSIALRRKVVRAVSKAGRGHIGPSLSPIEILRVLFDDVIRFDASRPDWVERDRVILSKGHGCLGLYALLADRAFFDESELDRFCSPEAMLGGHPERGRVPGVEASTGALGHGLAIGVGMAMAARLKGLPYRVYVIAGDGEMQEGSVWESCIACGRHGLSNLTLIVDRNGLQCYGDTESVAPLEPLGAKLSAFGFHVMSVDGHDVAQLRNAFARARQIVDRPVALICNTVKGKGLSFAEGDPAWHYRHVITREDADMMSRALDMAMQP